MVPPLEDLSFPFGDRDLPRGDLSLGGTFDCDDFCSELDFFGGVFELGTLIFYPDFFDVSDDFALGGRLGKSLLPLSLTSL